MPQDTAGFDDVFALAQTGELDGQELKKYINSMLDEYTVYTTTEYARQEGVKEGLEKGEKQGKIDVALNLKKLGVPVETIAQATGLSQEEIMALK